MARALGVEIESACGGEGTCGKCRLRVDSAPDSVSPPTAAESQVLGAEAVAAGMRLACQTLVAGDVWVFVPEESRRMGTVVGKEAGERTVPLDPAIKSYRLVLQPPTMEDPVADAERLLAALEHQHGVTGLECDLEVLQSLPGIARQAAWDLVVIVWRDEVVIDVRAGGDHRRCWDWRSTWARPPSRRISPIS